MFAYINATTTKSFNNLRNQGAQLKNEQDKTSFLCVMIDMNSSKGAITMTQIGVID